ncbi:hypothetical protein GCM10023161_29910 [Mycobacterium paraffinicum]|uniref:Uncharacterized protein n=1 Tax=Mycobacterium paraffinicum TaxID=53378 RepID=A0ABP8RQ47_9MYCO
MDPKAGGGRNGQSRRASSATAGTALSTVRHSISRKTRRIGLVHCPARACTTQAGSVLCKTTS